MTNSVTLKKTFEIEAIIAFALANSWRPRHSERNLRRFLSELISTQDLIFDLHDDQGRLATAVLLDKVNNPANDACLEILGLRSGVDARAIVTKFVVLAKPFVPKHRSGLQVGVYDDSFELEKLGLQEYYDTYDMVADVGEIFPTCKDIIRAARSNCNEIYETLCKSFAQNPEISIPDMESWQRSFGTNPRTHYFLWRTNGETLGFASLIDRDDGSSEVATIGVLPEARGKGIGEKLLRHCMSEAKNQGKTFCHLTVAAQNEKALGLYFKAGFNVVDKMKCYRAPVIRESFPAP